MPSEWPTAEFGELLDGGTRNGVYKPKEHHGSGVKIVNMGELFAHPRLRGVEMKRLRLSSDELEKSSLSPGDLLFARRSLVAEGAGKCSVVLDVPEPTTFESSIIRARPAREKASSLYLYYFFSSPMGRQLLGSILRQVAVSGITGTDLVRLRIPTPPLSVQVAIAAVLQSFDEKIELNRRMNETLEAMARATFKSWFVDFDPVRAKSEGRQPQGIPARIADLFPSTFQDSPLGPIPKGWKVVTLGDETDAVRGLSYKGAGLSEAGVPMHNLNSVFEGGGYKHSGIKHYIGEYKDRHVVDPGDVIVTNTEQGHDLLLIGYPAIVPKSFGKFGLFSHHLYRIRPKPASYLTPHFIYQLLMNPSVRDQVAGHTNGTTVNMLPIDGVQRPVFPRPSKELVEAFSALVGPFHQLQESNHDESEMLSKTRDTLLPKLLSGELALRTQAEAAT